MFPVPATLVLCGAQLGNYVVKIIQMSKSKKKSIKGPWIMKYSNSI